MYNRKRIARGSGAVLAVWALVGILLMSSGVAYGLPLAGVGGFVVSSNSVEADSTVIYPGVEETSQSGDYPQAVVELQGVTIENLGVQKTIPLNQLSAGSLSGNAQVRIFNNGTANSQNILLKTSALTASGGTFNDFRVQDRGSGSPGDSYKTWANDTSTLGSSTGIVVIRGHYLVADQVQTSDELAVVVCYDPDPENYDPNVATNFEYGTGACNYVDKPPQLQQ